MFCFADLYAEKVAGTTGWISSAPVSPNDLVWLPLLDMQVYGMLLKAARGCAESHVCLEFYLLPPSLPAVLFCVLFNLC